ncbi:hypothetical protein [Flavobacterium defluvii]|uniref:PRTRC system protein F n=1 Tax=Flavobacterium defluvii TaxID=370979 RepID=A0A1M5TBW6_9FLAO|nr:hypothetical protein [Flavobacterium defluvii]SHH48208.1 hypothetical protein SAMN05443663_1082 [Flavobacterium defluvii]
MNHAEKNDSRYNKPSTEKTKTAARPAGKFHGLDAQTQRRRGNSERQSKISPCRNASDNFLRVTFLPKLEQTKTVQPRRKLSKMQPQFYKSLSLLTAHYGITPMQADCFGYPYNLALSMWDAERMLKKQYADCPQISLMQDGTKTYLVSEETHDTGTTLYYIPVEPLYWMSHDAWYTKNAKLLYSVFSYLYHITDVPYYRQQDSYLYWMYEMHREWTEQDDEGEQTERLVSEFDKAELIGDYIEKKIYNPLNLTFFEHRLLAFKCRDAFDKECLSAAQKAHRLFSDYPNERIFRNAPACSEDGQNDEESESIPMHKYISFISHTKGWLYETLEQSINNEFNEYSQMHEPTIFKRFDDNADMHQSLDFERRFFSLLDDLCELLYDYKSDDDE